MIKIETSIERSFGAGIKYQFVEILHNLNFNRKCKFNGISHRTIINKYFPHKCRLHAVLKICFQFDILLRFKLKGPVLWFDLPRWFLVTEACFHLCICRVQLPNIFAAVGFLYPINKMNRIGKSL